ncbi:MAG TPA: endonuclease VII domain-containing protein [Methylomirabilota bacterium]|nr:endonuclease VII domain-containing protein [Methylomirabilota bacterium]
MDITQVLKYCPRCEKDKDLYEFYCRKKYRDGRSPWCKICMQEVSREWNKKHPERTKEHLKRWNEKNGERVREYQRKWNEKNLRIYQKTVSLKSRYNITLEEYNIMLDKQRGVCAICGKPETKVMRGKVKALSVDHNHETGKVRELLCGKHNMLLGLANDDTGVLETTIRYLQRHNR